MSCIHSDADHKALERARQRQSCRKAAQVARAVQTVPGTEDAEEAEEVDGGFE